MNADVGSLYRNILIEIDRMRCRMAKLAPGIIGHIDTYRSEVQKALHAQGVRL